MLTVQDASRRWKRTALSTLETAKRLREGDDRRSCVSRAYYAAYQAATAVCIAHGDSAAFPAGWNNPSHEQLPDLISSNGKFLLTTRRAVRKILRELRILREDADYRMGRTVDSHTVRTSLLMASTLFERLEIEDGDN
jgi:uncharacterized protein (UPF0332 family)